MFKHIAFPLAALAVLSCSPAPSSKAPEAPPVVALTSPTTVQAPVAFARVTSPLTVTGISRGWYFEGSFPAKLVAADGTVLAEAPAQAQGDWMTSAPVPFIATLMFTVTHDTPANIVLEQDMPREGQEPERVTVPVVLVAR